MPARYIVCSLCDGKRVDGEGNRCVECQGLGGSIYGEDRSHDAIVRELASTERILRLDLEELSRAEVKLRVCDGNQRGQCHSHILAVKSSMVYWEFRLGLLRHELIHCEARSRQEVR
jgi:hypothetical protein